MIAAITGECSSEPEVNDDPPADTVLHDCEDVQQAEDPNGLACDFEDACALGWDDGWGSPPLCGGFGYECVDGTAQHFDTRVECSPIEADAGVDPGRE